MTTTISLAKVLEIWHTLKRHDNEIMARRPDDTPRAAWRQQNPPPMPSSFRIYEGARTRTMYLKIDHAPAAIISSTGARARGLLSIRLDEPSAADILAGYAWPAPDDMTGNEFAAIRREIGLSPSQLAPLLDYSSVSIAGLEYDGTRKAPRRVARLMGAYRAGYRPADWPEMEKARP